jgi:hypothetical protein
MKTLFGPAALLLLLVSSGCFWKSTQPPPSEPALSLSNNTTNEPSGQDRLIVTLAEGLSGKVSALNTSLRFVVLTFPIGRMATLNQRLHVYRNGLKVGELNATGPQRDDSIVADIVAGEAQVGDDVRDR